MALQRPSTDLKNKTNVNPVVNRPSQATAEDFTEVSTILNEVIDNVELLKGSGTPNPNYGVYTTLALLQAAHPTGENGAYGIIDAGVGNTPQIAIWDINDLQWVINQADDNIVFVASVASLPAPGVEGKIYITLNDFYAFTWRNNTYNLLSKTGAVGVNELKPAFKSTVDLGNVSGVIEIDWNLAIRYKLHVTGNVTLTMVNYTDYAAAKVQDIFISSSSPSNTITWQSGVNVSDFDALPINFEASSIVNHISARCLNTDPKFQMSNYLIT